MPMGTCVTQIPHCDASAISLPPRRADSPRRGFFKAKRPMAEDECGARK